MAAKKKKKASKKKASKTTRRIANPLTCRLDAKKLFEVESGNVYAITCKGDGKSTIDLGHVTGGSETEAKKKARAYLKRLL